MKPDTGRVETYLRFPSGMQPAPGAMCKLSLAGVTFRLHYKISAKRPVRQEGYFLAVFLRAQSVMVGHT